MLVGKLWRKGIYVTEKMVKYEFRAASVPVGVLNFHDNAETAQKVLQ